MFLFFFFFFLVLPVYCYQPISLHPRAHMLSHVTPWTAARQATLSMDFSRQEYWSGLPFPRLNVSYIEFEVIKASTWDDQTCEFFLFIVFEVYWRISSVDFSSRAQDFIIFKKIVLLQKVACILQKNFLKTRRKQVLLFYSFVWLCCMAYGILVL